MISTRLHTRSGILFTICLGLVIAIGIEALVHATASGGGPIEGRHRLGTDEISAAAILGQQLPLVSAPVAVFARTELTADQTDLAAPGIPRMVHQAFAVDGTNIALLTVFRGSFVPDNYDVAVVDRGAVIGVTVRTILDGTTDVGYVWSRHGLVYNFHINLSHGIDRSLADRIATSIP